MGSMAGVVQVEGKETGDIKIEDEEVVMNIGIDGVGEDIEVATGGTDLRGLPLVLAPEEGYYTDGEGTVMMGMKWEGYDRGVEVVGDGPECPLCAWCASLVRLSHNYISVNPIH